MKKVIVLGGGIAGLVSSIILRSKGHQVVLIEKAKQLGGLLGSMKFEEEVFDFGTHILSETGNNELDHILFENVRGNSKDWNEFKVIKVGNFFNGSFYEFSESVDARVLGEKVLAQAMDELLALENLKIGEPRDCEEDVLIKYGETFYQEIFKPIIEKYFGCSPKELIPNAYWLFGPNRLVVADEKSSRELKSRSESLGRKLSYTTYFEGVSSLRKFYPKNKGISLWIEGLEKQAREIGVDFRLGTEVTEICAKNHTLKLGNESDLLRFDHLVSSIPPIFLVKALGLPVPVSAPPKFRKVIIEHYIIEGTELQTKNHFYADYDPRHTTFRVTIYPNLRGGDQKYQTITAEALVDAKKDPAEIKGRMFEELKDAGVISKNAQLKSMTQVVSPSGFPVLDHQFKQTFETQKEILRNELGPLTFVGKASGKFFFMNDVLEEVHSSLKAF